MSVNQWVVQEVVEWCKREGEIWFDGIESARQCLGSVVWEIDSLGTMARARARSLARALARSRAHVLTRSRARALARSRARALSRSRARAPALSLIHL